MCIQTWWETLESEFGGCGVVRQGPSWNRPLAVFTHGTSRIEPGAVSDTCYPIDVSNCLLCARSTERLCTHGDAGHGTLSNIARWTLSISLWGTQGHLQMHLHDCLFSLFPSAINYILCGVIDRVSKHCLVKYVGSAARGAAGLHRDMPSKWPRESNYMHPFALPTLRYVWIGNQVVPTVATAACCTVLQTCLFDLC